MGRAAKHNWQKLFLEYNQGRYKSVAEFAEKKGLSYDVLRKQFKKISEEPDSKEEPKTGHNRTKKPDKKTDRTKKELHPWEALKKQFLDWPEEKLQAYVVQLTARRDELEAIPFEELTPEEIKELGRIRRERRAILSDPDPEKICKVIRNGRKCNNPVERGKEVCWNHGGASTGPSPGTQNALKHGFFAKIFPNDEETREIYESIDIKNPLDILWDQIVIQYTAIARAQRIMFVKDKEDLTKILKRQKETSGLHSDGWEKEYELQFAWDKQANFLAAQSKAMTTLEKLVARYEAMLTDEQKVKVQRLKQDMEISRERLELDKAKVMGDPNETEDDGFIEALHSKAGEAWDEYSDSENGSTGDSGENSEAG